MDQVTRARVQKELADAAYVIALATGRPSRERAILAEIAAGRMADYIAAWAGTRTGDELSF